MKSGYKQFLNESKSKFIHDEIIRRHDLFHESYNKIKSWIKNSEIKFSGDNEVIFKNDKDAHCAIGALLSLKTFHVARGRCLYGHAAFESWDKKVAFILPLRNDMGLSEMTSFRHYSD